MEKSIDPLILTNAAGPSGLQSTNPPNTAMLGGMSRIWFCILVALVAATFADPLVEFASNAGAFGRCDCTDHSNVDIVPALCVGLLLGIALLSLRIRKALVGRSVAAPPTWRASDEVLRPSLLARLIPAVFAIQLAVLYAMETAEQFIVGGFALGGTIWLGGPVPISLAVHAAFGIIAMFVISRALCTFTQTAVRIAVFLRISTALSARGPRRMFARFRYPAAFRCAAPLVCRIGERAPPLLTA